ncbi:MAG: glycosyltransferase [Nanoarchaeota archaeon]
MDPRTDKFMRQRGADKVMGKAEAQLLNDKNIERVEIIVLKYKSPVMEEDCVSRIIRYTKWPYKINVFDNRGNGPNTSKAWNKLIKESTCDYVLFIDSDAFVHDTVGVINGKREEDGVCWVTEMVKAHKMIKNVAIVGPVCGTPAVTTLQSMRPKDEDPLEVHGHLSGYCFLTHKSIYDKIGYFDEDFCFYGQESDWIERILESNQYDNTDYKLMIAPRAHVIHGYENQGSIAAKQAEKEGELSQEMDSQYSYLMWNWKKMLRLEKRGVKYEFKF